MIWNRKAFLWRHKSIKTLSKTSSSLSDRHFGCRLETTIVPIATLLFATSQGSGLSSTQVAQKLGNNVKH